MPSLIVDALWLIFASGLAWVILERKKQKEKQSCKATLIIAFISWFVFNLLYRAVITSKGATQGDALLAGILFGGLVLLIFIGIKWLISRKKQAAKEG